MMMIHTELNNRNINELLNMLKCRIIQNNPLKNEIIVYLYFIKGNDQFVFSQEMKS